MDRLILLNVNIIGKVKKLWMANALAYFNIAIEMQKKVLITSAFETMS
jgi:hypothetical protein